MWCLRPFLQMDSEVVRVRWIGVEHEEHYIPSVHWDEEFIAGYQGKRFAVLPRGVQQAPNILHAISPPHKKKRVAERLHINCWDDPGNQSGEHVVIITVLLSSIHSPGNEQVEERQVFVMFPPQESQEQGPSSKTNGLIRDETCLGEPINTYIRSERRTALLKRNLCSSQIQPKLDSKLNDSNLNSDSYGALFIWHDHKPRSRMGTWSNPRKNMAQIMREVEKDAPHNWKSKLAPHNHTLNDELDLSRPSLRLAMQDS